MSILIKGMKMPEIKENKSIKAEIRNLDGRLELGIMTGGYYCCEQWSYYPIIEVPYGHGRLIDADELRKKYKRPMDWLDRKEVMYHVTGIWTSIDNAPTVIPTDEGEA